MIAALDKETTDRLLHLHAKAKQCHEQLEAWAAECCVLLGEDPGSDDKRADWCREIIDHQTYPLFIHARLQEDRRR